MRVELLRALRIVAQADSDPVRQALFENVARRSPAIRLARATSHGALRGRLPASALVALYGWHASRVARVPARGDDQTLLAFALYENERRTIREAIAGFGTERVAVCPARGRPWAGGPARRPRDAWRFLRAVHRICRRHDFLVACRLACTLATYLRARPRLAAAGFRAVLVASDYNAEASGLVAAARAAGIATAFVAHSHPHWLSPPLRFDLSILEGQAALDDYRARGPVSGRVVFKGIEGEPTPLDGRALLRPQPVIGIFPPREVVWPMLLRLLEEARSWLTPSRLVLRWHPNMLEGPCLERFPGLEECRPGSSLRDDARRCDWVIADESSSVHLAVLKAGVPTLSVRGLGVFPAGHEDFYGFTRRGVIPAPLTSLAKPDLQRLAMFYDAAWAKRFRLFDAPQGRPAASDLADAVRELVAGPGRGDRPLAASA